MEGPTDFGRQDLPKTDIERPGLSMVFSARAKEFLRQLELFVADMSERIAVPLIRKPAPNNTLADRLNRLDGTHIVGVAGNQHRNVVAVFIRAHDHVYGKIHIGFLFDMILPPAVESGLMSAQDEFDVPGPAKLVKEPLLILVLRRSRMRARRRVIAHLHQNVAVAGARQLPGQEWDIDDISNAGASAGEMEIGPIHEDFESWLALRPRSDRCFVHRTKITRGCA